MKGGDWQCQSLRLLRGCETPVVVAEGSATRMRGKRLKVLRDLLETVVLAAALAYLIRGFAIEAFFVRGGSMEPTLHDAEVLFLNKLAYRFGRPQRRDVIVFRCPRPPHSDFVKRVVALAGEVVEMRDGAVYIDGRLYEEPYLARPGHFSFAPTQVPPGHLFVLGDNRMVSDDSRAFGFVPLADVKGKAWFVYWPVRSARAVR